MAAEAEGWREALPVRNLPQVVLRSMAEVRSAMMMGKRRLAELIAAAELRKLIFPIAR